MMSPIIELYRIDASSSDGTFGVMQIQKKYRFSTLEPYHRSNEKSISSIPSGMYKIKRKVSPKYGETFEVCDIYGRSHVLFHNGNFDHHTEGCILLGLGFGVWGAQEVITQSKDAFAAFKKILNGIDQAELIIREVF
jgi:hypothetical protein